MKLDTVIAERNNKTIYRDGDKCVKVFNEEYSKADDIAEYIEVYRIAQNVAKHNRRFVSSHLQTHSQAFAPRFRESSPGRNGKPFAPGAAKLHRNP